MHRFACSSGERGRTNPWFGELEVAQQVVGQIHTADLDLGPRLADCTDELAAHAVLLEAEDVLDTRAHLGTAVVGRLLLVAERLVVLTLLADVALVARHAQCRLGRFAAVFAVGRDLRVGVRGGGLEVADELVLGIQVDVFVVAEVTLPVLFGPPRIGVFLPAFVLLPVLGYLACLNAAVLLAAVALDPPRDDLGIDDLGIACFRTGLRPVIAKPIEQRFAELQPLEPLAKPPHRRGVGHAVVQLQAEKAGKREPVADLVLHRLIGQFVERL